MIVSNWNLFRWLSNKEQWKGVFWDLCLFKVFAFQHNSRVYLLHQYAAGVHEYAAILGEERIEGYSGQGASLSVNQPFIGDQKTDSSLSLTISQWLEDFSSPGTMNTAEVGWQVYPARWTESNPDKRLAPHLFVHWTSEGYQLTGCYELTCPGFLQVDKNLGARWSTDSRSCEL
jgi:hypothetical protein